MKYKVGDKVRVISGLIVDGAYGNWGFTEKMKKYKSIVRRKQCGICN